MHTARHGLRRTYVTAIIIMMVALGVTGSLASAQQSPAMPTADRTFANKAAVGGQAEVELGKLAQERASNDAVRQFGQRMATDHGKANEELMQLAKSKNLSLATDLDSKHKQLRDKLAKQSGDAFDRAYMSEMVKDHKNDVAEFKKQADRGKDPDLKAWASQKLPTLQEHLRMAQDIEKQVKSTKSGSR
jgi:putative membrane protein